MKHCRVLVLGASGFLGQAFCRLHNTDAEVLPAVSKGSHGNNSRICDIRKKDEVRALLKYFQPTHILNFASLGVSRDASSLKDLLDINTLGALNIVDSVLEESLDATMFMFGTGYEYQSCDERLSETSVLMPISPYAVSKTTLAYALQSYRADASIIYLRLFNTFGQGEPSGRLILFLVQQALDSLKTPLTRAQQIRDFMYVEDLISIFVRLIYCDMFSRPCYETINVGTGRPIVLRDFIFMASDALKDAGLDSHLQFGALPYREQDPMVCVPDISKLESFIGSVNFTDKRLAIKQTVEGILREKRYG